MKTSVFKKAVALVLSFMMLFSMIATAVSATEAASLNVTTDKDIYSVGDEVVITATLPSIGAFQGIGLSVDYCDETFTFVSAQWVADGVLTDYTSDVKRGVFAFANDTEFEGDVFVLTLSVNEDAVAEEEVVTLTPVIKNAAGDVIDCEAGSVVVAIKYACEHVYDNDCDAECNLCGENREVADHVYDNDCDADCNVCGATREVGDHVYDNACDDKCNVCGATRLVGNHVYDNACDADCNECGDTRVPADHVYDNGCDADCNVCGAIREVADHVYDNDCDADCNTCGETREVAGHVYDNDCDADCNTCGETREVAGHVYDNDCDADCNTCGETREVADHAWETKYDDNGHWTECNCGATSDVVAHEYTWEVTTEATDAANGEKSGTCDCGHTTTKIVPRKLKMNTVTLTLANSIAANFKANGEHFTTYGYTDPYMKIVRGDKVEEIPLTEIETDGNARRVFTFGITPQLLNDEFEYYLCAYYDGELYTSDVKTYKIANYCYSQARKSTTTAAFKTLYVDLLNYATAAQIQKNHNTDNLANADLSDTEKAWGTTPLYNKTDYTSVTNKNHAVIDNPTAEFKTVTLRLDQTVEVKLSAVFPSNDIAKYKVIATNGSTVWEITSDSFIATTTDKRYDFYFSGLAAHQMDDTVEYTVYEITDNGDVAISNTLAYSVESYVYSNIEKETVAATMKDVYAYLMAYGRAANNAR